MKKLNKIYVIFLCLLSGLIISCKDEDKTTEPQEVVTEQSSTTEMKDDMAKSSDTKYNPAHGIEGHRCDLPVGAPLEKAEASTNQEMTSSPLRLKSAAPKINPAHGEPGHDCSVPVGGELN